MIDLAGDILILTGPPGSGKTTTARLLAAMPSSTKVHLHADDFWHFIKHGALSPYRPEAHRQNGVVVDVLANAAAGYAGGGCFVIVDGIIGPWFLEPFRSLRVPLHYMVLRPPLDLAIRRCQARGGDTLTDAATIAALHDQLADLGDFERHVLAVADEDPPVTVGKVIDGLSSGRYRLQANR